MPYTEMAKQYPLRILLAEDNIVNQKLTLAIAFTDGLQRRHGKQWFGGSFGFGTKAI